MESVLTKPIVLKLNRNWERIEWTTPKDALIAMCSNPSGTPPALAMSIDVDENGNLVEALPVTFDEWIKLPVREIDLSIGTKNGAIRCPLVIIAANYSKMPMKTPRLSTGNILERDGYIDQYTGEKLSKSEANVDHVIPRHLGGRDSWENMVCTSRKLNSMKGHRRNEELGLRLIRKPKAPMAIPASATIRRGHHKHHEPFII